MTQELPEGTVTVLFTDVEGSTELTNRLGDDAAREILSACDELVRQQVARRVDLLAERLGFDRKRLLGWGLAQAVLSAWWSIEDHGNGWEPSVAVAEALLEIDGGHSLWRAGD